MPVSLDRDFKRKWGAVSKNDFSAGKANDVFKRGQAGLTSNAKTNKLLPRMENGQGEPKLSNA